MRLSSVIRSTWSEFAGDSALRKGPVRFDELALKQLELNAQQAIPPRDQTPAFRVESAVKLIPKFNEHDIETFLLTFEKIAELNKFPCDKYAAVLQAHLTGKALKVFTELSVADCQDYSKLKAALLKAYAVVLEVYRKRFRAVGKSHSETYSEFAFRLFTHFKRWLLIKLSDCVRSFRWNSLPQY